MKILFLTIVLCCLWNMAGAQYTTRITHESVLVLPSDYDPSVSYPVVVMLPFTGGDAEYMFDAYAYEAGLSDGTLSEKLDAILNVFNANRPDNLRKFAVILPKGKGSRKDHSWKGFEMCFTRYEERVIKDLDKFSELYNLDTERVYLAGVSLGGDLSWALSLRNPEKFAGAVVMGSRCSYVPPAGSLQTMYDKNYAFFMTMGMKEANDRLAGIRYARKQLDSMQILNIYKEMPDLYHHKAPLWLFLEGVEYLFSVKHKIREVKTVGEDVCVKTVGIYSGDLEINHYNRNLENEDITLTGDGLFVPHHTEFIADVGLEILQCGPSKITIRLMHNELPAFAAYTAESQLNGLQTVDITIYEQEIRGYKYRGSNEGETDSKVHGVLSLDPRDRFLSITFDVYKSTSPDKWVTYTYFAKIEE
jgi:pimeloyl-ACP methyl ester carboxylesterase